MGGCIGRPRMRQLQWPANQDTGGGRGGVRVGGVGVGVVAVRGTAFSCERLDALAEQAPEGGGVGLG